MIKLQGFDEKGRAISKGVVVHQWEDLPMKGLGKSMDGVGIDEPIIVPHSVASYGVIWDYTHAEIERRAHELGAEINWMELPCKSLSDAQKTQIWFSISNKRQ